MISGFPYKNQGDCVYRTDPDRIAIVAYRDGTRSEIDFGHFDALVDNATERLLSLGLDAGDRVAILSINSVEFLAAFLGILRAGLVSVPLSYKFPAETLDYVLDNCGARAVLVDDPSRVPAITDASGRSEFSVLPLTELVKPWTGPRLPRHARAGDDTAMILYTSGSTGLPKGVMLSQDSHLWVLSTGFALDSDAQSVLVAAPLYHMNALANCQAALLRGDRIILLDVFDARRFLEVASAEKVTRITGVPPMMALALKEQDVVATHDFSSVRELFLGSAPASDELLRETLAVFPNARLNLGYGTTESGPVAFTVPQGTTAPLGSVGVPSSAVDLRLVGPDGVENDHEGVLEIRCPALLSGYFRRPDIPRPVTKDGYYHTKDVFRRDDNGYFFFVGREDDMFSSGGENVFPRAVEKVLEDHPDVAEAAVVPLPDRVKGARPVAFVVPVRGRHPREDELRAWTLTRLEPFAHPRRVFFVDALPLSGTNKVDKALLTRKACELTGVER